MKVLLLNGSPHKTGTTVRALEEVAATLKENDIQSELIHIDAKTQGCIGCYKCFDIGHCVFSDLVNELIGRANEFDGIIVGTPVFYASPSGSILAFLDRLFFAGSKHFKYKPAASIAVARRAGTNSAIDVLNKYFTFNNMPLISSNYWTGAFGSESDDLIQDEEGLQIMQVLGHNMAWLLKSIEAGKQSGVERPLTEDKIYTNFIRE